MSRLLDETVMHRNVPDLEPTRFQHIDQEDIKWVLIRANNIARWAQELNNAELGADDAAHAGQLVKKIAQAMAPLALEMANFHPQHLP